MTANPRRSRAARSTAVSVFAAGMLLTLAGCRFDGINSYALPGNSIDGDSYRVTVEMEDIQNLVANSEVKADNVTIGTIRKVDIEGWTAELTLDISEDVELPANVTAKLAQKSLLGAQYLELTTPAGQDAVGRLGGGDTIPISRTSRYPETEEVLSTLSLVLNGSGLEQIRTITSELNNVMSGREENIHGMLSNLEVFVRSLDEQRGNITRAIDSLDRLAGVLGEQTVTIDRGIESIQPAVEILDRQQNDLEAMLRSVGAFGDVAHRVLDSSGDDLTANLTSLAPTLTELAAAGSDLPEALILAASVPFPLTSAENIVKGDYLNLFMTLDLSTQTISNDILGSIPVDHWAGLRNATRASNPFLAPTEDGNALETLTQGTPR
ncbi:MAG: MCE family protein [Rhodococcus sp. (in: high G+C Gram-positive bacteria)]|uniref:MCE family protein n=1 Tax=Rhodococcus sp. TaxID=1831 RepID=UPI003BAF639A